MRHYTNRTVLEAARDRISMLFDEFDTIHVSVSSGKDSTVLYHLALQEAILRDRKIVAFFLDQEAEYAASIRLIESMMNHPNVIPAWYQVPLYLTNATSYDEVFLYAWGEGEKWVREKHPIGIHEIKEDYPRRFYTFLGWYGKQYDSKTAHLVGIRADESLMRYRAVTKFPGWHGLRWSTLDGPTAKFYPIYDWGVTDVWKFMYDYNIEYNGIYDLMYKANYSIYSSMRVSNLIHEKSYKCLTDLPRFEPETYDRLCARISGISTASRYASEKLIFSNKTLPKHYASWREFRDFLLAAIPKEEYRSKFAARFEKQPQTERTFQAQVGQLLVNDYENSKPIDTKQSERTAELRRKWMEIL